MKIALGSDIWKGKTYKAGKIYSLIIKSNRVQEPKCGGETSYVTCGNSLLMVCPFPACESYGGLAHACDKGWVMNFELRSACQMKIWTIEMSAFTIWNFKKNNAPLDYNNPPTFSISGSWL